MITSERNPAGVVLSFLLLFTLSRVSQKLRHGVFSRGEQITIVTRLVIRSDNAGQQRPSVR